MRWKPRNFRGAEIDEYGALTRLLDLRFDYDNETMIAMRQQQTALQHAPAPSPVRRELLQRKCACGAHTVSGGECAECIGKKARLQRELAIGASGDASELEADRVADRVMTMASHSRAGEVSPGIQRFSGHSCGQMQEPLSVDHAIASPGRPLEPALRQDMEQRFGYDFTRVRVHSDAAAETSARDVDAHAYTVGHDIVFGAGRFAPGTHDGRRLIAHELTHVVQQSAADRIAAGQNADQRRLQPVARLMLVQRQPDKSPRKEEPAKKPAVEEAHKKQPAAKTLKSEGVGLSDPVAASTATVIDEVLARNKRLAPYIGDRLKGGLRIAEKGKFIQDSTDGNFDDAYRKAYKLDSSQNVSKDTTGFFDPTKSEVHVRPGAKFGTALHESLHRLASPALYANYLKLADKISTNLNEVLREGVTAFFTDLVLKDEGLPNFNDAYRKKKEQAEKLITALGANGFDLIAKFNFKGSAVVEIGEKLGYTRKQFNASQGQGISEVLKLMNKAL